MYESDNLIFDLQRDSTSQTNSEGLTVLWTEVFEYEFYAALVWIYTDTLANLG